MTFKKWLLALVVLLDQAAFGKTASPSDSIAMDLEQSDRMKNRVGAYVGILGDPFPTLIGVNLAYNVFDFMRATAGIGQISASMGSASASATTVGAGARFLVPNWNVSPVAGLSLAYVGYSSDGLSVSAGGFSASGMHVYANFGVDWQTQSGFNLGAGYNVSLRSGVGGLPYVNIGWFKNWI